VVVVALISIASKLNSREWRGKGGVVAIGSLDF
jgi:hypothetical protein